MARSIGRVWLALPEVGCRRDGVLVFLRYPECRIDQCSAREGRNISKAETNMISFSAHSINYLAIRPTGLDAFRPIVVLDCGG